MKITYNNRQNGLPFTKKNFPREEVFVWRTRLYKIIHWFEYDLDYDSGKSKKYCVADAYCFNTNCISTFKEIDIKEYYKAEIKNIEVDII